MGNPKHLFFPVLLFMIFSFLTACSGKEFTAVFDTPRVPLEITLVNENEEVVDRLEKRVSGEIRRTC